jgi:transcription termination/antitermination protein NusG
MAIFAIRTTANREEQVLDFVSANVKKKSLDIYSIIHPHGMRGYVFIEAEHRQVVEEAFQGVPYARGLLHSPIEYKEIEHMLEQAKTKVNIRKNDIVEIISGPFKHEKAKVSRIDKQKEEIIIELLEAAVQIPITIKLDSVKVIHREGEEQEVKEE